MSWGIVASVGVGLVGSAMSSDASSSASGDASAAQSAAAQAQIEESRRQFDEIRKLLNPYVTAGNSSLGQQQNLIGLNGAGAQQTAINALSNSPQMSALVKQGENSILQNASATGGLRGGNTQAALAQFRPQLLNQLIDQQYSRLGGITSMGQNAAAGVGNAGMQSSGQVINALGQQGAAQAGGYLAQGQNQQNLLGSLAGAAGQAFGGGGFSNLGNVFGGSGLGSNSYGGTGTNSFGGFGATESFGGGSGFGNLGSGFF